MSSSKMLWLHNLAEVAEVRNMLGSRYDDIKSGRVKPIDGEAFFDNFRQRDPPSHL
jgi:hypothetical protein